MRPRWLALGMLSCALVASSACSLDFSRFKQSPATQGSDGGKSSDDGGGLLGDGGNSSHDDGGSHGDASSSHGDAGSLHDDGGSSAHDAGQPVGDGSVDGSTTTPEPKICTPLETRCAQTRVEVCAEQGDAWNKETECGAKSCNPVTLACNACSAPVEDDGVLSCTSARAEPTGDVVASTDTTGASDTDHGSCGGTGSPERVIEWIAPETDYWVLDTRGSSYDTVLYARDCACDGAELGCNNNADSTTSDSDLVAHFERGQRVAVFVDGNAGDKGEAVLNAHPVTCPTLDLDAAALPSTFMDKGKDGSESFRFTPETTAFYSIRVHTKSGSKVCLSQGARCGGATIACNTGSGTYGAQVIRELPADQPITIDVTLMSGDTSFDLDIKPVSDASCASNDIFDNLNQTLTFAATSNYLTSSCAPPGSSQHSMPAFAELQYKLHSTLRGISVYVISVSSDFPAAVYLLHNDCRGEELDCTIGAYDSTAMKYVSSVSVKGAPTDEDYVVAIENIDENTGGSGTEFQTQIMLLQ